MSDICPNCRVREVVFDAKLCHPCRDVALGFADKDEVEERPVEKFSREPDPAAVLREPTDSETREPFEGAD